MAHRQGPLVTEALFVLLQVGLGIGVLCVTLRLLVGLLLRFCIAPGIRAVVVFLPSRARVLVDVSLMPGIGIHGAAGGPTHCSMRRAVRTKELSKVSGTANCPGK